MRGVIRSLVDESSERGQCRMSKGAHVVAVLSVMRVTDGRIWSVGEGKCCPG